MLEVTAYLKLE